MSSQSQSGVLLIRADAGPTIGAGHVMRCLALAQQWRLDGGRVTFACSELPRPLGDRLRSEGCDVVMLGHQVASPADAGATLQLARTLDAVVVVDGYRFSPGYQRDLYGRARVLLVLDDFGQIGSYHADLVLDQNLGTTEATYADRPPQCRLLLGPEHVLLRREFLDVDRRHPDGGSTVRDVLVTTGGADACGLSGTVLEVLDEAPGRLNVTVVIGGAGGGRARTLADRRSRSHHRVRLVEDPRDMAELMAGADLAVSAAGSTVWELAFLGVPAVVGVVAENQRRGASALARCGAVEAFDATSGRGAGQLRRTLGTLLDDRERRSRMSAIARRIVDGHGAARVVGHLLGQQPEAHGGQA